MAIPLYEVREMNPDQAELNLTGTTPADAVQVGGDHYKQMAVQPWAAMEAWMTHEQFCGYLLGTALAYLARVNVEGADGKGGIRDIQKAAHVLQKLIEVDQAHCG